MPWVSRTRTAPSVPWTMLRFVKWLWLDHATAAPWCANWRRDGTNASYRDYIFIQVILARALDLKATVGPPSYAVKLAL